MQTDIRIKVKTRLSSDGVGSQIIISKFHDACENLDASIFEPFIKEDDMFEDVGKWEFLTNLKETFELVKVDLGIDALAQQKGHCTHCHPNAEVTEYADPMTGKIHFAYFFEILEGQLTDVYKCVASSGWCGQNPEVSGLMKDLEDVLF